MRILFQFFVFCFVIVFSYTKPSEKDGAGTKVDENGNDTVMYSEKLNSNTSTAGMVMLTFSKLTKPQSESESKNDPPVPEPTKPSNITSTSPIIPGTVQRVQFHYIPAVNKSLEIPTAINEHLQDPDSESQEDEQTEIPNNNPQDEETLFQFRGPGLGRPPPPRPPQLQIPTMTEEDEKARELWGGDCLSEDWKRCSTIDGWGGNYFIKDKKNPGKFILKQNGNIPCVSPPKSKNVEKTYCLNNGYTVARCHMLCMSQCNNDYRIQYDKLVQHEGECANPLIRG